MNLTDPKLTVGWREWLVLPNLCSIPIKAKIDTGAKTSALHAYDIETIEHNGVEHISFELHPFVDSEVSAPRVEIPIIEYRTVSSSNGARELRPVIETQLVVGHRTWTIEVTLTNRVDMGFAMLLGRSAMHQRIVVDPSVSFLLQPDRTAHANLTTPSGCTLPSA
jgi:hypothetical protein